MGETMRKAILIILLATAYYRDNLEILREDK